MGCGVSRPAGFRLLPQVSFQHPVGTTDEIAMQYYIEEEAVECKRDSSSQEPNGFEEIRPTEGVKLALSLPTKSNKQMVVVHGEEGKKKKTMTIATNDAEEDDLGSMIGPASPSFRVFITDPIDYSEDNIGDESSRNHEAKAKGTTNTKSAKRTDSVASTISNESSKKEKGRRLWTLAKRPVTVYSWWQVQPDQGRRGL